MKKLLSGLVFVVLLIINSQAADPVKSGTDANGSVIYLTDATFKQQVFDYEVNREWKYAGTMPAIIDFYADWCGPCRMVSPVLEELAKEYRGRIIVYKVDTQKERLLSQNLGIQSLPTLLFIPATGKPQVVMGALPKEMLVKAIQEVLLVN